MLREQLLVEWTNLQEKLTKQQQFLAIYHKSQALMISVASFTTVQQVQEFFAQHNAPYWHFLGITGWKWGNEVNLTQLIKGEIKHLFFNPQKDNLPFAITYSYKGGDNTGYPPNFKLWLRAMLSDRGDFLHNNNFECLTDQHWTNPGTIKLVKK